MYVLIHERTGKVFARGTRADIRVQEAALKAALPGARFRLVSTGRPKVSGPIREAMRRNVRTFRDGTVVRYGL